jgi:hypothetical protein
MEIDDRGKSLCVRALLTLVHNLNTLIDLFQIIMLLLQLSS